MENWRARRISGTCPAAGSTSSAKNSANANQRRDPFMFPPGFCRSSVDRIAERLHQLGITLDIAIQEAREFLDRAPRHFIPERGKMPIELGFMDDVVDRRIELADDVGRRTAGRHDADIADRRVV